MRLTTIATTACICTVLCVAPWSLAETAVVDAPASLAAPAVVKQSSLALASMFSDHMVLQRDMRVPIWGTAASGAKIVVQFAGQTKEATADAAGTWRVDLAPLAVSAEPKELSVAAGDQTLHVADVLVGDVWLASGQSNMEWIVRNSDNAELEIAAAHENAIRQIDVPNVFSDGPQTTFDSPGWKPCDSPNVGDVSAVAYFFARNLHEHLKIPIGIVGCNWGGTPMEAWTSREALAANPTFADDEAQARAQLDKKNDQGQPLFWPQNVPSALSDGMLAPVIPFAIRGVIWYQGEANAGRTRSTSNSQS